MFQDNNLINTLFRIDGFEDYSSFKLRQTEYKKSYTNGHTIKASE